MRRLALVVALSSILGGTAHAQTVPAGDVAVSYSFLRFLEAGGFNMPGGWLVSISGDVGGPVSVIGEVAGNYRSEAGETLQVYTYQGGVRVSPRASQRVRPYAQLLAGAATASCCGRSETRFSIEPGGGVDLPIGERAAIRIGAGFPIGFDDGSTTELFRFHAGVVFNFGNR